MKRFFLLFCPFFLFGCATPKTETVSFNVKLQEACDYSVRMTVPKQTMENSPNNMLNKQLNIREIAKLLSDDDDCESCALNTAHEFFQKVFPSELSITISNNGQERSFNKEQFLEILKHAEDEDEDEESGHEAINDTFPCPMP